MNSLDFMNSNGFINIDTSGSFYVFANIFSNTAYTFLQILIAFSAAKAFGANPYLGAVIGMIMINPSLQNAYTVATEGVQATQSVFFGLYDIDMVGYRSGFRMGGKCGSECDSVAAYPAAWDRKPYHGRTLCSNGCNRHPPDVHGH